MRSARRNPLYLVIGLAPLLMISGCNLFTPLHTDGVESEAHVLTADGTAALKRGDYGNAAEYFRLAIQHNPRDGEARRGYAEAYLHARGFSLGKFVDALMSAEKNNNNNAVTLITPASWGVGTLADVEQILTTVLQTLEPIALGKTDGPYLSTDVTVNLTVGLFYLLRVADRMQELAGTFTVRNFQKNSPAVASWGLPASVLSQLPDEFLWIADAAGNQPSLTFITSLQQDVDTGVQRLQVAADNSQDRKTIDDIIKLFKDWKPLANQ